jgi:hypothetical protein
MLVTPAEALPVGDWAYELKWDGMRALVAVDGNRITQSLLVQWLAGRRSGEPVEGFGQRRGIRRA